MLVCATCGKGMQLYGQTEGGKYRNFLCVEGGGDLLEQLRYFRR